MAFSHLRSALDALCGEQLPGAALVVSVHDKPAFVYGAGFSDEENEAPFDENTRLSAYSMTKPLTAALTMKAREKKLIDLNAPIRTYLHEFSDFDVELTEPGGKRIMQAKNEPRVIDLLTMSAGFGDDMRFLAHAPTRKAVKPLAARPLLFESGTRWLYGLCYEVLGALLEEVYGQKLRCLFRSEIFAHCGMKDSCFLGEVGDTSAIAPIYRAKNPGYESAPLDLTYAPHPGYDSAGAGLVTSAADYDKFLRALMHGRLIDQESLSLMKRDYLSDTMRRDFNWPQVRGYGYGAGIRVPLRGSTLCDYGWGGAAGAYCLMDFERDASLSFFTNVLKADEAYLYPLLRDAFTADIAEFSK